MCLFSGRRVPGGMCMVKEQQEQQEQQQEQQASKAGTGTTDDRAGSEITFTGWTNYNPGNRK